MALDAFAFPLKRRRWIKEEKSGGKASVKNSDSWRRPRPALPKYKPEERVKVGFEKRRQEGWRHKGGVMGSRVVVRYLSFWFFHLRLSMAEFFCPPRSFNLGAKNEYITAFYVQKCPSCTSSCRNERPPGINFAHAIKNSAHHTANPHILKRTSFIV